MMAVSHGPASRLDDHIAQTMGFTRSRAAALIREGRVHVNGIAVTKCGTRIRENDAVVIVQPPRYVSRGGEKLEAALAAFEINPTGMRVLDIGISTGGFTDCVLQAGAARVIGVDVGHGQLAPSLSTDARLELHEGVNARELRLRMPQLILEPVDLITIDVSFISLQYVLPELRSLLRERGCCIALLKPQFEVGRSGLGQGGVVRDPALHAKVLQRLERSAPEHGFVMSQHIDSPILGSEGNREFFVLLEATGAN